MYGMSGAGGGTAAGGQGGMPSVATAEGPSAGMGQMMGLAMMKANLDLIKANADKAKAEANQISGAGTDKLKQDTLLSAANTYGKGTMSDKHKGGRVTIKCEEPCFVMAIFSLTPRLDYSQGNQWEMNIQNYDQLHKPALNLS